VKSPIELLKEEGQMVWLDSLDRHMLTSGELARQVEAGSITGVTSNPTILHNAIRGSSDYILAFRAAAARSLTPDEALLEIVGEDVRLAADTLRGVYKRTHGQDGFVSLEVASGEMGAMMAEARRMFALVDRPNVMIKIPGTSAGVDAVTELISEGININITLLFDVDVYERFANAYIRGLELRKGDGKPLGSVASVASFFVSRVDTKADRRLPADSWLRGKVAIANACLAYERFQSIFHGPRWETLFAAGARVQKPLWASTGTKNPAYSDVLYVENLVAPDSINTMTPATLQAFLDHGTIGRTIQEEMTNAKTVLRDAQAAGIDLAVTAAELLAEGLAAFESDSRGLLDAVEEGLKRAVATRSKRQIAGRPI
jgi:transaldolase